MKAQVALVVLSFERFLDISCNVHEPMPVTMRLHIEALRPYVYKALSRTASQIQGPVQDSLRPT